MVSRSHATFPIAGGWGGARRAAAHPSASQAGLEAVSAVKRSLGSGVPPWLWERCRWPSELQAVLGQEHPPCPARGCSAGDAAQRGLPPAIRLRLKASAAAMRRCHDGLFSAWVAFLADLLLLKPRYPDKDKSSGLSGMFFSDFERIPCFYYQSQTSYEFANRNCSNKLFLFKGWFLFMCSTIQCFISCKSYIAFRDLGTIDLYSMY